jgi:hypothetical protein
MGKYYVLGVLTPYHGFQLAAHQLNTETDFSQRSHI